jgi:hypothetical protein
MKPDIKPELQQMIDNIAKKNMFYGNKIPDSIMSQFEIVEGLFHCGVLVPFWLSVLQRGRGGRKGKRDSGLWMRIYSWMERRGMFKRAAGGKFPTKQNKINQAKGVTWYINKYGNKQFRDKKFIDIYESERKIFIAEVDKKFSAEISRITMAVI